MGQSEVKLSHADAFIKLLKSISNRDQMAGLSVRYKEKLPEDVAQALRKIKPRLPTTFADVLGDFAEARLGEDFLSSNMPIAECFEFMEEMQAPEIQDVVTTLPDGLQMGH